MFVIVVNFIRQGISMKKINLLPWREIKVNQQRNEFIIYGCNALLMCIGLLFILKFLINYQIDKYSLYSEQLLNRLGYISLEINKKKQLTNKLKELKNRIILVQTNHSQLRKILDFITYIKKFTMTGIFIKIIEYQKPLLNLYVESSSKKIALSLIDSLSSKYKHKIKWRSVNNSENTPYNFIITVDF